MPRLGATNWRSISTRRCGGGVREAVRRMLCSGRRESDADLLAAPALGALATLLGKDLFAQPDLAWGDLDELVGLDVLEGDLERQQPRGLEQDVLIGARRPHVGQLLFLAWIDDHVTAAGVLTDDHALVDVVSRLYEHGPALLQVVERKAHGLASGHADHHAIAAAGNLSLERPVVVEVVMHDGLALGGTHEATAQADQASSGD